MNEYCARNEKCRVCGSSEFDEILNLGTMPPANSFLKKEELETKELAFPLAAYVCQQCKLLQLLDRVHPQLLFRHYDYMTSASKPLADHFTAYGEELVRRFVRSQNDLVAEIGGNDAVLLGHIREKCRVLNIEPAGNIAEIARNRGVETIHDFFSRDLAGRILGSHGPAKVITANNVVAHIDDLDDLFEGVKELMGKDGVFVCEVHWVGNLIGDGGFDQIYHEHLSYFSLSTFIRLAELHGLFVFDVKLVPMHGQSLRLFGGAD